MINFRSQATPLAAAETRHRGQTPPQVPETRQLGKTGRVVFKQTLRGNSRVGRAPGPAGERAVR